MVMPRYFDAIMPLSQSMLEATAVAFALRRMMLRAMRQDVCRAATPLRATPSPIR